MFHRILLVERYKNTLRCCPTSVRFQWPRPHMTSFPQSNQFRRACGLFDIHSFVGDPDVLNYTLNCSYDWPHGKFIKIISISNVHREYIILYFPINNVDETQIIFTYMSSGKVIMFSFYLIFYILVPKFKSFVSEIKRFISSIFRRLRFIKQLVKLYIFSEFLVSKQTKNVIHLYLNNHKFKRRFDLIFDFQNYKTV